MIGNQAVLRLLREGSENLELAQMKSEDNEDATTDDIEDVDPAVHEARVYVDESTKERDRIVNLLGELHTKIGDPEYPELYKKYIDSFNKWQQELNFALKRTRKELLPEVRSENPAALDELNAELNKLEALFKWKVEEWPILQRQLQSPFTKEGEQSDDKNSTIEGNKAELAFKSALHFNRTSTGFNPAEWPKENEVSIIWWRVWNPGWKTARAHTNRLSIYNTEKCGGCRYERDRVFLAKPSGPSIEAIIQSGTSDYENSVKIRGLPAGSYEAYVELDINNQIDELNERNNALSLPFRVEAQK